LVLRGRQSLIWAPAYDPALVTLRAATVEELAENPVGLGGRRGYAHFACRRRFGASFCRRPNEETAMKLGRSLVLELSPPAEPHASIVDASRLVGGNVSAFALLQRYLERHGETLAKQVTKLALVRPSGLEGAIVAGAYEVLPRPYAVTVFGSMDAALEWLAVEDRPATARLIEEYTEAVTGTPALIRRALVARSAPLRSDDRVRRPRSRSPAIAPTAAKARRDIPEEWAGARSRSAAFARGQRCGAHDDRSGRLRVTATLQCSLPQRDGRVPERVASRPRDLESLSIVVKNLPMRSRWPAIPPWFSPSARSSSRVRRGQRKEVPTHLARATTVVVRDELETHDGHGTIVTLDTTDRVHTTDRPTERPSDRVVRVRRRSVSLGRGSPDGGRQDKRGDDPGHPDEPGIVVITKLRRARRPAKCSRDRRVAMDRRGTASEAGPAAAAHQSPKIGSVRRQAVCLATEDDVDLSALVLLDVRAGVLAEEDLGRVRRVVVTPTVRILAVLAVVERLLRRVRGREDHVHLREVDHHPVRRHRNSVLARA
jgi:hypothetical protein